MRIDRYYKLNTYSEENYLDVMEKSLVHTLPNGLQFYNPVNGDGNSTSLFLVDSDMVILCRIIAEDYSSIHIDEM